jgi:hypothetical protein
MKTFKEITRTMSSVNNERRHFLPSKVIWDGTKDRFEVFQIFFEDCHRHIWPFILFKFSVECYVDFMHEIPSVSQIKKDARALYGTILSACQNGVCRRIVMENRDK